MISNFFQRKIQVLSSLFSLLARIPLLIKVCVCAYVFVFRHGRSKVRLGMYQRLMGKQHENRFWAKDQIFSDNRWIQLDSQKRESDTDQSVFNFSRMPNRGNNHSRNDQGIVLSSLLELRVTINIGSVLQYSS